MCKFQGFLGNKFNRICISTTTTTTAPTDYNRDIFKVLLEHLYVLYLLAETMVKTQWAFHAAKYILIEIFCRRGRFSIQMLSVCTTFGQCSLSCCWLFEKVSNWKFMHTIVYVVFLWGDGRNSLHSKPNFQIEIEKSIEQKLSKIEQWALNCSNKMTFAN